MTDNQYLFYSEKRKRNKRETRITLSPRESIAKQKINTEMNGNSPIVGF